MEQRSGTPKEEEDMDANEGVDSIFMMAGLAKADEVPAAGTEPAAEPPAATPEAEGQLPE